MRIVKSTGAGHRVRADLARLDKKASELFITSRVVQRFMGGEGKLDVKASSIILTADRSIKYVEKFSSSRVRIRRADHIIALLCLYSEDSFGARVLAEDFHKKVRALQELLEGYKDKPYDALTIGLDVISFMSRTEMFYDKSPAPLYLLMNFFLFQEGLSLILEDTDEVNSTLGMTMRYKVESYAKKR